MEKNEFDIESTFMLQHFENELKIDPELEKMLIEEALLSSGGHKQKASKLLGWGRNTLTRKQKELYIDDSDQNQN